MSNESGGAFYFTLFVLGLVGIFALVVLGSKSHIEKAFGLSGNYPTRDDLNKYVTRDELEKILKKYIGRSESRTIPYRLDVDEE